MYLKGICLTTLLKEKAGKEEGGKLRKIKVKEILRKKWEERYLCSYS